MKSGGVTVSTGKLSTDCMRRFVGWPPKKPTKTTNANDKIVSGVDFAYANADADLAIAV